MAKKYFFLQLIVFTLLALGCGLDAYAADKAVLVMVTAYTKNAPGNPVASYPDACVGDFVPDVTHLAMGKEVFEPGNLYEATSISSYARGEKIAKALGDYNLIEKTRTSLLNDLKEKGINAIPVCLAGEDPSSSGCVKVEDSETLVAEHGDKDLLLVSIRYYGIYNRKAFFRSYAMYMDINETKGDWVYHIWWPPDEEFEKAEEKPGDEWAADPDGLVKTYDGLIAGFSSTIAKIVAGELDPKKVFPKLEKLSTNKRTVKVMLKTAIKAGQKYKAP